MLNEVKRTNYERYAAFQGISYVGFNKYFFILFCLFLTTANAIDTAMMDVAKITSTTWNLEGVKLSLEDINKKNSQLILSATKLTLPKPFNDLSLADIHCDKLVWTQNEMDCLQGKASVKSVYWQSPSTDLTFHLNSKSSTFQLANARLGDSRLSLNAEFKGNDWRIQAEAKHVNKALLNKLSPLMSLKSKLAFIKQGSLNLSATLSGRDDKVLAFDVTAKINGVTGQTEDGKMAAENTNLQLHLKGNALNGLWHWQGESRLLGGALYVDPVYLEVTGQPISVNAQGTTNLVTSFTDIQSFSFQQPDVVRVSGSAQGSFSKQVHVDKADVVLHSDTLQSLLTTYINPFFTESLFANIKISGNLETRLSVVQQTLTDAAVNFGKINIEDDQGRIAVKEGKGSVNWSANPVEKKQSELSWQVLSLKGVPIDSATLKFASWGNSFRLTDNVKLPVLNGTIAVDKFSLQPKPNDEPDVSFAGSVDNLSLEQLSKRMGWTPLSGNISGQIPGVDYHNKVLSLGGELLIKVFDGTIKISQLKSSGLFSGFPRVESEIELDNLDLEQLTSKFEFGAITGRLSGFINNLVLDNWHPVSFYAWFGTPDDDDSSHRISQKAVKNIASIGGGGASDLLSRSFLSLFETFRYDKIGMGCYLHDGVCQMMGLEAEGQGYYLIKGGLLPRIDVVGYNPRVNWDVLVERLGRVAAPEKAVIQ
ncbi:MAG: C4-dicarboxylate ABC transporter [Methylococcaceae bacterium]|nr:C4-dicarboxylate ABC transporter [Methylococcaceae bacterium]